MMIRRMFLLILVTVILSSCSTYSHYDASPQRLETLPQRYSEFDLKLAWDIRVTGDQTVIDGVVKNVRYAYMHDLEIWVVVLDPDGKVVARAMTFVIPIQLRMDEIAAFEVKLPVAVAPGTRLHFTYKYIGDDGGDVGLFRGGLGMNWMQSFETIVPPR